MKNFLHTSISGPFSAPIKIHIQVECFSLCFNVNRSVRFIPHKAGNIIQLSSSHSRIAETNSLNMSAD